MLQTGKKSRIDRILLIEVEKGDAGIGSQHIMTRDRQRGGIELADEQRRQQGDPESAADQAEKHDRG